MSRGNAFKLAVVLTVVISLLVAGTALAAKGGGGKPTFEYTNNLSFPAIGADGKVIGEVTESFSVPYIDPATGQPMIIAGYVPDTPWYAQKVDGNKWNAEFYNAGPLPEIVSVFGMDWGDNIESVSPTIGRPYRLETGLFVDRRANPMTGYVMAMLANPSSPDEIQGTNTATYPSDYATIASGLPDLRVQFIGDVPAEATLSWDATANLWYYMDGEEKVTPLDTAPAFAPELNVAGKYIYGASTGGWKPVALGKYRITFYVPTTSQIKMDANTTIGNLIGGVWYPMGTEPAEGEALAVTEEEGAVATPVLDVAKNLSYVDVTVVSKGGK